MHFHEVGAVDAIGEVCGVALALESLGIDAIVCSPLPVGRGFVEGRARAAAAARARPTLELLRGAPLYGVDLDAELVTPTGAALVAALASEFGPVPRDDAERPATAPARATSSALPNVVRVIVGAAEGHGRAQASR